MNKFWCDHRIVIVGTAIWLCLIAAFFMLDESPMRELVGNHASEAFGIWGAVIALTYFKGRKEKG